jgi:exopolysaccharide production protein ExoZ
MVVIYHAMRWSSPSFEIGAAGVDIFFVISGFILWTVAAERPIGPHTFLARRWIRVAPLYWVLTLFVAALAWRWPGAFWDAEVDLRHLLLSLAFIQHLNNAGQPFPIITAGWSLNYEALFYLIFGASLFAPQRWRFWALAAGLMCVPVIGLLFRGAWFLGWNLMFVQFLAGAALAQWRLTFGLPGRGAGIILLVLGVLTFAAMAPLDLFEAIYRAVWWGIPAFLVVAGMVMIEGERPLPNIKPLRLLGDASYSIYLAHVVAVQLLSHLIDAAEPIFIPVAIVVSLIAGFAAHYALERPLIRLFRRPGKPASAASA